MSEHPAPIQTAIPESLRKQLEEFRRVLWRRKVVEAVAAGMIGLFVSFLLIFGLDRVWQTPGWARLLILLGGASLFAVFAPYWLHRWVWGNRQEGQLARLIARRFPGLGDRLLGVIELQGQQEAGDSLSPRLRAAAMEVVAAEAGKRDLASALPTPRHRKWGLAALLLMGLVATAFMVTPKAGVNALQRWLMPFSDTERYTFTQLESPISYLAVPYGESFAISLKLSKSSEQRPSSAEGRYGLQPELRAALKDGGYTFRFPGQQEKGTVVFRIGDLKHLIAVEPMQRPGVKGTKALVNYPDYMGIPDKEVQLTTGEISLVEGSGVVFQMDLDRPVRSGAFGPARASGEMESVSTFEPFSGALAVSADTVSTAAIEVGAIPFEIPFTWQDEFGLIGGSEFRLRVDAVKDAPPVSYTQGIERQVAILPEEALDFEILGEDDFGLKETGIEWENIGNPSGGQTGAKGELVLGKGGPEENRIMKPVAFSPAAFGMGPQRILMRSFSQDYFPDRGRVYSEPVLIYILSREEHAQLLKSQFDRAIGELEDLARKELNLLDENQKLDRMDGEDLQKDENLKKLAEQEQAEDANAEKMKELTEKMEDVMKGATRNGEIDKETLKKMAEAMKSMQELAEKDIPKVRDKLGESKEQSNTAEKTDSDVQEAVEEQKKVVEKMKEAIEQANDANKRFEASTFVARLKKAASEEEGIAATLIQGMKTLGERYDLIDPSAQMKLTESSGQQAQIGADVRWIQEDLGHYYARTNKESFRSIMEKMRDAKIDSELEEVKGKLEQNHSYEATERAKEAARKLAEWAAILGDELEKEGGGGGGDGGGPSPEDEDFEFMLRVMKMIQTQQDLRSRTRVLEQLKRDAGASPGQGR
ncbi:hypothetical protein HZ994_17310 [Akkermansiaceae bacterium]|nr:hypothetical protein HZ994_17310 [Akkermansiaceae bacterium]